MLILRNLRRRKRHQAPEEDSGSQDNSSRATDNTAIRERQQHRRQVSGCMKFPQCPNQYIACRSPSVPCCRA